MHLQWDFATVAIYLYVCKCNKFR